MTLAMCIAYLPFACWVVKELQAPTIDKTRVYQ